MADPGELFLEGFFRNAQLQQQRQQFEKELVFRQGIAGMEDQRARDLSGQQMDFETMRNSQIRGEEGQKLDLQKVQDNRAAAAQKFGEQLQMLNLGVHPQLAPASTSDSIFQNNVLPIGDQFMRIRQPEEMAQMGARAATLKSDAESQQKLLNGIREFNTFKTALGHPMDPEVEDRLKLFHISGTDAVKAAYDKEPKDTPDQMYAQMSKVSHSYQAIRGTVLNIFDQVKSDPNFLNDPGNKAIFEKAVSAVQNDMKTLEELKAKTAAARNSGLVIDAAREQDFKALSQEIGDVGSQFKSNPAALKQKLISAVRSGKYRSDAIKMYQEFLRNQDPHYSNMLDEILSGGFGGGADANTGARPGLDQPGR